MSFYLISRQSPPHRFFLSRFCPRPQSLKPYFLCLLPWLRLHFAYPPPTSWCCHTSSPFIYTPPSYGSSEPQSPTSLDTSPPATPSQAKDLQIAVGYLLYYGRAVDLRFLPATCALASEQASSTSETMTRLDRLLGYAAAHPYGRKIFRASTMVLRSLSDASYLSRPRAGSVAGSHHFLGDHCDDARLNHPISTHSTRLVVCSFVAEAEYAGLFAAGRIATNERQILEDMGHPQPPTPLFCDNEVAIGLATDTINLKMSKSLDMRFHWLWDRVRQGHFRIIFVPGKINVANFFTKALPVTRHRTLAPFLAIDPDDNISCHTLSLRNLNVLSLLYCQKVGQGYTRALLQYTTLGD